MVPNTLSELFRRLGGANGEAPADWIRCSNSFFVFGQVSSECGLSTSDGGESRGVGNTEADPRAEGDEDEDDEVAFAGDREFVAVGDT